jgi:hypothetical protein
MSGTTDGLYTAVRPAPVPFPSRASSSANPVAAARRSGTAIAAKASELSTARPKNGSSSRSAKFSRPT